ncbi:SMP-30/gluconolactonase/LRE family protein [Paraburkholderia caballeronis]|uniref:SMP-30/gluconolactonase/LRE family protein n=1 Tax=Paraburkholderia caballeronis TaxID=416943 RepID=UPI001065E5D2|nr:SMP-30/gluconolactonase/LRE family protein [Paraburkholderia caballeronis]TDV18369.1 L-arabinonolactonase [Paraburkholderia caballeronis]TDV20093.1 L-arabinonolactonase [Paraburkholderia caballeronis]TDV28310.1 L-arabinonolactonase [Paraburkholderia caballeronis]
MSGVSGNTEATLAVDARNALGEGATWCARTGRLYWVDIEGARLWRYDSSDGSREGWPMPERLATFALCDDPRLLLLGLASRLAFFDLDSGRIDPLVEIEPDLNTRVNDGRCDRQGRFVFGTKDEGSPLSAVGGFYRLNRDLSLERLPLPAPAISNSIAFSPDGATMYYCDSPRREIRACDYGADGRIANDRRFVALAEADGVPDGSTVDADGGLWNAQWGGARVVRYDASGRETERVTVPTPQPSCVTLGGARLTTLYVTSAREEMSPAALAGDPHAGGIFAAEVGRRGLPEPVFAGAPRG